MSVYVDEANYPYGRMKMCHMIADTEQELHAMADKIGVRRKWYQTKTKHHHYDICKAKRALAVKHGAKEVDTRRIIEVSLNMRRDGGQNAKTQRASRSA